ncbi:PAS domain S-box protein [Tolypothrix sp. FACHB-123]|uniref:PAS domain S-box protein n=1 Tax=Tolypothrix sp. FACHB-123 TaxID=2692868 RepID=UPI00168566F0|nr:PAS domain S-box protein [Tolypothrix sp. FACHB-123]MBD2356259.1 PAS domain S-box protein [Tolypothrix sp. FACHB-123]
MTIFTINVLIIDDCLEDRETYRRYLLRDKQNTYRILEAETGTQALELCRQQIPDVILLDYLLPDRDGLELLNKFKTLLGQTNPPVIILTGQGNEQVAVQAIKSGAAEYLVKRDTTSTRLCVAIQNVLERTRLSRDLEESEALFRATFNQAAVGIAHVGIDGQLLLVNQKLCDILGYTCAELLTHRLQDITHPDDRNLDLDEVERILAGEISSYSLEKRYIRYDNTHIWIDLTVSVVRKKSGEPEYLLCVIQDISDRKGLEIERNQAEMALGASEERLRLALELNSIGMWEWDAVTGNVSWNDYNYRLLGYQPGEVEPSYNLWHDHIYPDDVAEVDRKLAQALANQTDYEAELRVILADGSIRWLLGKGRGIYDESGQPLRMIGVSFDISDRKQAEIEIRRFVSLADNSSEFIGMCDMNFVPFYLNEAGKQMVGLDDIQQYKETPVREFFFPEDQDFIINEFFPRVLREGRAEVEIRFRHFKTGEALWMVYSVYYIKDTNDQLIGLATISRNISDRKQAEEKIREQAALLDVATDAIFVRDLEHHILYWNSSAERVYGWQAAEVLGKNCCEFLCQQPLSSMSEALKTVTEKGEWHGEINKITKSGQEIIVQSRWTLMLPEARQAQSILVVDTDITEKKHLEQQFYRAQRLESLGTLASGIAHDLNNILTPLLAVAQLLPLKLPHLDEKNQRLLKILEDNSKRGAELVKQITAFARGAEGKRVLLQPRHLIKEIERVIKSTFPKEIEICIDITTANLWTVLADPTQIHQVLMNLCVNARDAMPDGGTLTISAENFYVDQNYAQMNLEAKVGKYVVITVSDTGCGIPKELLDRIFEPFFTTKELGKGTGLGLSTIIGIIKNHNGFVKVDSEVGKGSQFQVYLSASDTPTTEETDNSQIAKGNSELILVVDDEPFVRDIAKTSLEEFNYRVQIASDAIEAFLFYAQHKTEISLVLMDIQMPHIDGFKAIRVLQQMNPAIKIIVISGIKSNQNLLETRGINVQGFLSKPYTIKELLDTIKLVLSAP